MKSLIYVEEQADWILVRCDGTLDVDSMRSMVEQLRQRDAERGDPLDRIVDARAIIDIDAHFSDLIGLASDLNARREGPTPRTAFVVADDLQRGFASMWRSVVTEGHRYIRSFSHIEHALRWLKDSVDGDFR